MRLPTRPVAVAVAVVALAAAAPAGAAEPAAFFPTPCDFSHRAANDPIVSPGRPGASHSHDFFGNFSTDAGSRLATLAAAGTSCHRIADRAAYWVPTLLLDGREVTPLRAQIYYLSGQSDPTTVRAFPPGLKLIAGAPHATAPQSTSVVSWHCGEASDVRPQSSVPTCANGERLRLRVRFPSCWNGSSLDSEDHQGHVLYPAGGRCPDSHPVPVPQIVFNVIYPVAGGPRVALSSGPAHTAHADFFNAWEQPELDRLVAACINARRGHESECRPPSGPVARPAPPLVLSAATVVYGGLVTLTGSFPGAMDQGVRIEAERRGAWQPLAPLTAGPGGSFALAFRPGSTSRYRAVASDGRISPGAEVVVTPRLSMSARLRAGLVRVSARVRPMKRRVIVRVDRLAGERARTVRRIVLRTRRGRAAGALRLTRPGHYRLQAVTRGDALHGPAASPVRTVEVRG